MSKSSIPRDVKDYIRECVDNDSNCQYIYSKTNPESNKSTIVSEYYEYHADCNYIHVLDPLLARAVPQTPLQEPPK